MKTSGFTNFIYLLYGENDDCFMEAAYSIGTLLKKIDSTLSRIIIYTDQPEKIKSWPVICESITGHIETMKGPTNFGHRIKLCVILRCLESYSGKVVYLDSDTFIRNALQRTVDSLEPGRGLMHRFESRNPIPELSGFQTRLPNGTLYHYRINSWTYNAGVIGIHPDDKEIVAISLAICDALLNLKKNNFIEQFSISEAMRISGMKIFETFPAITHYWRSKSRIYMRKKILQVSVNSKKAPWKFDRMIPFSYPRILCFKIFEKFCA